jgi:polar amino acid transport system substrate-binding protein
VPKAAATSAPSSAAPAPAPTCDAGTALRSYAPASTLPGPGDLPPGSTMAKIRKRGRLIAGVSADTFLLGSRNPLTGKIEGFDIDFVRQLAAAIFGNPDRYQLRVITAADRLPLLQKDEVDVVVRNMTINCTRWESIAFSAEYYASGQKIMVRRGSDITGLSTLAGHRVCAPTGTSSLDNLRRLAPKATAVEAPNHTSCLVKFQQGDVDAITGDDTVLAGLASQDPYAVVLKEKPFTSEPYGIGVNKDHVDLVRFINGVLEKMRADGAWENSYRTWLAPTLGRSPGQPRPQYGRQP